jgi:hypothetical protein
LSIVSVFVLMLQLQFHIHVRLLGGTTGDKKDKAGGSGGEPDQPDQRAPSRAQRYVFQKKFESLPVDIQEYYTELKGSDKRGIQRRSALPKSSM